MIREEYQGTRIEDIHFQNRDFWIYYLMNGFGARYLEVAGSVSSEVEYIRDNRYYLPAYLRFVYRPSLEWAKRFTCFDEEVNAVLSPSGDGQSLELPVPACEKVPDGGTLRVEFHLHYVIYYLNGEPLVEPLISGSELLNWIKSNEITEQFFFLLAVTAIERKERLELQKWIFQCLKELPLYHSTLVFLAEALAADNARLEQPEKPERRVQAVFYEEQERFCFKAEVYLRGIKLYRQTDFGWEETALLPGEGKQAKALDLEGKKRFALEKLRNMQQPKPKKLFTVYFDPTYMDTKHGIAMPKDEDRTDISNNLQKAARIIEGLKEQECYSKERERAYVPGFPWNQEEITQPVRNFFAEYGGWMTEAFVILHMGSQPKKCFDRIFFSKMNIFGFDLYFHSPEFARSLQVRESDLKQKIKEKYLIVGSLGWGEKYEEDGDFAPIPFAIGESGSFYAHKTSHFLRADTFPELVARCYDFTDVTAMEVYEARLTVSKLDRRLEYCYTEEDYQEWLNRKTPFLPEMFTKFGI